MANMIRDASVPEGFAALVDIQRSVAKYTALISEHPDCGAVLSLISLFEHELDVIKTRFERAWGIHTDLASLTAKLHLYATLAVNQGKSAAADDQALHAQGSSDAHHTQLAQGLITAVQVVRTMTSQACSTQPEHPLSTVTSNLAEYQLYNDGLPKFHFRTLVFSAFYLLRYFALNGQSMTADRDLARSHIIMVLNYLRKYSADPLDECGRAAAVIDALNQGGSTSQKTASRTSLRVRERLAASIFYDALTVANELRERPVQLENTQENPQQNPEAQTPATMASSLAATHTLEAGDPALELGWDWQSILTPQMMEGFDLNFDLDTLGFVGDPASYELL